MKLGAAVWMYGSSARGDQDDSSDLDVLIVGRPSSVAPNVAELARRSPRASISTYSWAEIERMCEYGSLFLQHLRLEARPLFEDEMCVGNLRKELDRLGPYTRAQRDVSAFKAVLGDVRDSLPIADLVGFELSVLATVTRHAAILGCWLLGEPCFSRTEPVRRFARACQLGWDDLGTFPDLYAYRLYYDGRSEKADLVDVCAQTWVRHATELVSAVEEVANAHSGSMS